MNIKIGFLRNECPRHAHKCYEIIIYTKGHGIFSVNESKFQFSAGTIVILPPNTQHESISNDDFERIFINGNFDWILNNSAPIILQRHAAADGLFLANLIYRNRYEKKEYLITLVNAFLSFILQNADIDDKMNSTIKSIINEITERFFDADINVNNLLRKSGYSEDYIRAEFKKVTGKTPIGFLTEIRVSHACLLIDMYKNTLSLAEIAGKCGYTDYIYFSRRFKAIMGVSPQEYLRSLK